MAGPVESIERVPNMASPKLIRVPIGGDLAVKASRAIGRSVVRKFLVLIEAGRIAVELPTGDRVERSTGFRASSSVSYFPADFAFEDLLTRRAGKSGSEDRRSGEFRRELCVDVAGVAKAFPREVAAGSNGSASTRRSGGFENTTSATARLASDLA
jgi:hypothetical protein